MGSSVGSQVVNPRRPGVKIPRQPMTGTNGLIVHGPMADISDKQLKNSHEKWWAREDLNLRPMDY